MSEPPLPRHWRQMYENKYLGEWNLYDSAKGRYIEATVVIASVTIEEVKGEGGKVEECTVLRFRGKRTPMILTRRQGKNLQRLHGIDPNNWAGKTITLWAEERKVKGEMCRVLSIRTNSARGEDMKRAMRPEAIETFDGDGTEPEAALNREPGED